MKKFAKEAEKGPVGHSCCDICAKVCSNFALVVMSVLVRNSVTVAICNHQLPILMPGGGRRGGLPLSGGVPLGSRKSYHLLDQILQIL